MPKKKEPPLTPAEQKKRFEAMAKRHGEQVSPKAFKELVGRIALSKGGKLPAKPK